MGQPKPPGHPDLICVFVRLREYGADEFYVLTWEDLQGVCIAHHRNYLARHDGVRPKKFDSFHTAIRPEMLEDHRDKWELLETRLREAG